MCNNSGVFRDLHITSGSRWTDCQTSYHVDKFTVRKPRFCADKPAARLDLHFSRFMKARHDHCRKFCASLRLDLGDAATDRLAKTDLLPDQTALHVTLPRRGWLARTRFAKKLTELSPSK